MKNKCKCFWVLICKHMGHICPIWLFLNINIHTIIDCHLKTLFHNIQYYIIHNNILFLVDTYF